MGPDPRAVAVTRAKIAATIGLKSTVTTLSIWMVAWGLTVIILRTMFAIPTPPLLWGLIGVPLSLAVGVFVARRRTPPVSAVRALLDHHLQYGGLLMAAAEVDPGRWKITPAKDSPVKVKWDGGRSVAILASAAAFVLVGFLLPTHLLNTAAASRLQIRTEVEKLADQLEVLKEENVLPPERAKSLEESLSKLEREAAGNDPGKTWEAMDHLERAMAQASLEAAEQAARDARNSAASQEFAEALNSAGSKMGSDALAEAMKGLAKEINDLAEENKLLDPELSDALADALADGELSEEELQSLSKSLSKLKGKKLDKLRKLSNAKLIDSSKLAECEGACKINPDALAEVLAKCQGEKEVGICLATCRLPGRGGVSRGRGDAAMTWTDGTDAEGMKFKEQALPPGAAASLKDARLQAISIGDPQSDQPAGETAGGALDLSSAGSGSARTQVILPEHKRAVQRYFERTPRSSGEGR